MTFTRACSVLAAILILPAFGLSALGAPNLPEGYRLVYEQDFEKPGALNDFRYTDPVAWRHASIDGNHALEQHGESRYKPEHRSPYNLAILATHQFESFILEADLQQTGREYNHRDMVIAFGFVDPSKFYYSHLATRSDDTAHNILLVNDKPRTKISSMASPGIDWGKKQWRKIRLVREVESGLIEVYFDDMDKPVMAAKDKTFTKGYIGFGSFDDSGMVDNVKIWAPKAHHSFATKLFAAKPLHEIEKEPDLRADGFVSLFDGTTLEGWERAEGKASGKMKYAVDDHAIVGTCVVKEPNGFLRTKKLYRDFIFTCEVKFDVLGNSGIQFRSLQREKDGRVFGYQCEVDHSERRYSGGIYDEARRGWLYPLWGAMHEKARGAFKYGEWNRFTIQARGRRLQTWVNGVPCSDFTDTDGKAFTPEGFIALQVHGGPKGQIRWRHLRIKSIDASEGSSRPSAKSKEGS